ncbi:MAG: Hsp70 family protein, partial [Candidatus Omnitrophica bacterium]|nr:Hsp70 family protein [Candidatus Omnitrophota bacterium]
QMANDNVELGRFDLVGIPPAPRGVPQVEVGFDIEKDGIVHVSAKDLGTGKEQSIRITAPKKLSPEEIDKMVKNAEKFADQDKKLKESVEAKNQADTMIYATEKAVKDYGDKISAAEKTGIEEKLKDLKEKIKTDNVDDIRKAMEELQKASYKLSEEIYKQASAKQEGASTQQGGQSKPQDGKKPDEDVVDADFKVDDDKK